MSCNKVVDLVCGKYQACKREKLSAKVDSGFPLSRE